jgi:hypothetical protein
MRTSNRIRWATLLVAATLATPGLAVDSPIKEEMRFKLFYAQSILEGIVTENFPLISTNTYKMKRFSQQPAWDVRQTQEYRKLTSDFQRALSSLSIAAEQRNVDSATVYYFQLTTSCVTCHKHLRGAQVSSTTRPEDSLLALRETPWRAGEKAKKGQ